MVSLYSKLNINKLNCQAIFNPAKKKENIRDVGDIII
jgi:hypothetical protein